MPFVQRVVNPVFIARSSHRPSSPTKQQQDHQSQNDHYDAGAVASTSAVGAIVSQRGPDIPLTIAASRNKAVNDHELEAVTNLTLSNALRQLASLVLIANDIFTELNQELRTVTERSTAIKQRLCTLECRVDAQDPKLVTVPESDLVTFVHIKNHFKSKLPVDMQLFTPATRSTAIQDLYDAAALTPVHCMEEMDRILGREHRTSSEIFLCTPILGLNRKRMRHNVDVEIETRLPSAIEDLRKWTSLEAIGDVTVTPDCISRVNITLGGHSQANATIASNQGLSGTLLSITPPSPLSPTTTDETDNITVISYPNIRQMSHIQHSLEPNVPLDHRLPSPEEQCQILASKFPAEMVEVDVTGRRFDRMSNARKSMIQLRTTALATAKAGPSSPSTQDGSDEIVEETVVDSGGEVHTVRRRSRTRKPRGKRRNTLAGTDQREIEEAANGERPQTHGATMNDNDRGPEDVDDILIPIRKYHSMKMKQQQGPPPRSKSSDVLKNASNGTASSISANGVDMVTFKSQTLSGHFNSLKQWGKNRLRMINSRNSSDHDAMTDGGKAGSFAIAGNQNGMDKKLSDIDNFNVHETMDHMKRAYGKWQASGDRDRALSHERKPSYSSSEKSLPLSLGSQMANHSLPASINPVKMRESASIKRQRRLGMGYKEEPNNSSSGNWSASSESGRTSIGSEITVQPKSSASSNSLNHTLHMGGSSGPPSSIISRRRFFNTSTSSSVTSEGTATPDQMHELMYDDMETSSAYSCDTEGYYTSFHVDSGLKTLKEEEPSTPLHVSSALSSTNSFSSGNQTVVENEYELFGRGSQSTTTSSAGTICTTLMAAGSDRSLIVGPTVPERKSSLTKLNRSNSTASSNRNSLEPLERSHSSSTMGSASTIDRMGTIKRNGVLLQKEITVVTIHQDSPVKKDSRMESPDSGNNTSTSPVDSNANSNSPQGVRSCSEFEYSESSDLEGVDRIERIRTKTTINSSRIPSLCVITPSNSDEESGPVNEKHGRAKLGTPLSEKKKLIIETDLDQLDFNNPIPSPSSQPQSPTTTAIPIGVNDLRRGQVQHVKKTTLLPLNSMLGRLKGVLPHLNKKSPLKDASEKIYDVAGEYVTITETNLGLPKRIASGGNYYSNDLLKRNLATVLSGNLNDETEYVSLNELPCNMRCENNLLAASHNHSKGIEASKLTTNESSNASVIGTNDVEQAKTAGVGGNYSQNNNNGARVKFDAHGKIIYNSDSLKRRKGAHTTFAPGPCVKTSQSSAHQALDVVVTPSVSSNSVDSTLLQVERGVLEGKVIVETSEGGAGVKQLHHTSVQRNGAIEPTVDLPLPPPPLSEEDFIICAKTNNNDEQRINGNLGCNSSSNNNGVSANGSISGSRSQHVGIVRKLRAPATKTYQHQALTPPLPPPPPPPPVLLEEEDNNKLLEMIPSSMGPLKNSGAYSTLPKLSSASSVAAVAGVSSIITQPTSSSSGSHGYQPLYHNMMMVRGDEVQQQQQQQRNLHYQQPMVPEPEEQQPLSLDQHLASMNDSRRAKDPLSLQRNSNSPYWTLQLKNRSGQTGAGASPNVVNKKVNLEDLYSTPNKLTKTARTIGTPGSGFSTFFRSQTQTPGGENTTATTMLSESSGIVEPISPINPRNMMNTSADTSILTSTPTGKTSIQESCYNQPPTPPIKPTTLSDDLRIKLRLASDGIRSHGNSPCNSGRSTPRGLEPQQQQPRGRHSWANDSVEIPQTQCSDRLGTPKTSLMDFKKLLLSKAAGKSTKTSSAVEQLLLKKPTKPNVEQVTKPNLIGTPNKSQNLSSLTIQDLSGSPKTFASRRMLRGGMNNFGSPPARGKLNTAKAVTERNVAAVKKNVKHDVMSTTIPEVNNEEDNSSPTTSLAQLRQQISDELLSPVSPPSPAPTGGGNTIKAAEGVNLRENFFLKTEENNFPRYEIQQNKQQHQQLLNNYSRKQLLQQQRQQFLGNLNNLATNNNSHYVQNRNLGGKLTVIAENQVAVSEGMTKEALPNITPPLTPSLETSL